MRTYQNTFLRLIRYQYQKSTETTRKEYKGIKYRTTLNTLKTENIH